MEVFNQNNQENVNNGGSHFETLASLSKRGLSEYYLYKQGQLSDSEKINDYLKQSAQATIDYSKTKTIHFLLEQDFSIKNIKEKLFLETNNNEKKESLHLNEKNNYSNFSITYQTKKFDMKNSNFEKSKFRILLSLNQIQSIFFTGILPSTWPKFSFFLPFKKIIINLLKNTTSSK